MVKPAGCKGCPLEHIGKGFVPDEQHANPRLIIQGEAPGTDEVDAGQPFVGKAGWWLWKNILEQAGVTRDDCYIGNTLRCLPPVNKAGEFYPVGSTKVVAEQHCRQYDRHTKEASNVPLMLFGAHAMSVRLGTDRVSQWHGHIASVDGRVTGCTYHPAAVMRQPNLLPVVISDITNLLTATSDVEVLQRPVVYKTADRDAFSGRECVIDFEWNPDRTITVIGTATSGNVAHSVYANNRGLEAIQGYKGTLIGHNLIDADFDVMNWFPESFAPERVFDTKVVAHIVHAHLAELGLLSLGSLTRMYAPTENWKEDKEDALEYNGRDCAYNYRLYQHLCADIASTNQRHLIEKQQRLAVLAVHMRRHGVAVDSAAIRAFEANWKANREALKAAFPFNPNSPKQILKWAEAEGIALKDTTFDSIAATAKRSGSEVLSKLASYKDEGKPITTWFDAEAAERGIIHPTFSVTGTSVARFSSSEPNCQNIPPYLRHIIIPRSKELELVSFDFSNIENRTAAYIAGDMEALELWSTGVDPYIATAALMNGCTYAQVTPEQRAEAKTTELATLYGETEYNLAVRLFGNRRRDAVDKARSLQYAYFAARPRIRQWQQAITRQMDSGNITLRNPFGRVRYIYAQDSHNRMKRACHYLGCSTAADIVNQRALDIHAHTNAMPILIVHDELVYEQEKGAAGEKLTRQIREVLDETVKEVGDLQFPYKQKTGNNYGTMIKSMHD